MLVLVTKCGMKCALLILLVCMGSACTSQHAAVKTARIMQTLGVKPEVAVSRTEAWVLPASVSAYVHYPEVDTRLQAQYPRLQFTLLETAKSQLSGVVHSVVAAPYGQTWVKSQNTARVKGSSILIKTEVMLVTDKINSVDEWRLDFRRPSRSQKPVGRDTLLVRMHLYDVVSGRRLDTVTTKSRGTLWAKHMKQPGGLVRPVIAAFTESISTPQNKMYSTNVNGYY